VARKPNEPNKSEAIRQVLEVRPKLSAAEVVQAVAEESGLSVTTALVYNVRASLRNGKKSKNKNKKPVEAATAKPSGTPLQLVLKVNDLATNLGGIKYLKQLVDAMAN